MRKKGFYQDDHNSHQKDQKHDVYCKHDHIYDECDICCKDQGALVEKVICSENVLTTTELILPAAIEAGGPGSPLYDFLTGGTLPAGLQATVTPDYNAINQEVTVLNDAVHIFGTLPVTLTLTTTAATPPAGFPLSIRIILYFQKIVDCPCACPGDRATVRTPKIEKTFNQPLFGTGPNGVLTINLLLFKAIIRTHVTITRQGIQKNGKFCDLDRNRCKDTTTPGTINSPNPQTPANLPAAATASTGFPPTPPTV